MPHVELTVSLEIREGAGLSEIEAIIHQELMAADRKALARCSRCWIHPPSPHQAGHAKRTGR